MSLFNPMMFNNEVAGDLVPMLAVAGLARCGVGHDVAGSPAGFKERNMQSLNPAHTYDELERAYRSFMNAPAERRDELSAVLQRSIRRTEIELNNLRDVDNDYEQRILAKKLLGLAELAKGSLAQG
jgi:hypothetical protein